jgi:D-psicose/D-tagatose/L-ribulose 3-epimerase
MPVPYRFAICNELFEKRSFAEVCPRLRSLGYEGIELAPFTLGEDPAALPRAERVELAAQIADAGLSFVGLHWVLAAPPGLHVTAQDEKQRRHTWDYVGRLIDMCAELAQASRSENTVIVFGSPKQRSSNGGLSAKECVDIFRDEMARAAPRAQAGGVTLLLEALSPSQTDVVTSLAEAVEIVKQIQSPAVQTMFDVHNAIDETDPHTELVRKFQPYIRHVHVNEMDGREPGMGDYAFEPLLATLAELEYPGWVSVEAFDFSRDSYDVASRAISHLKAAIHIGATTGAPGRVAAHIL